MQREIGKYLKFPTLGNGCTKLQKKETWKEKKLSRHDYWLAAPLFWLWRENKTIKSSVLKIYVSLSISIIGESDEAVLKISIISSDSFSTKWQ